jgi:hypothetical protein
LIAILVALAAGYVVALSPIFGIALIVLLVGASAVLLDPDAVERATATLLLGGATILGYGFANVGVPGPVPLPAAELLLLPLAGVALLSRTRIDSRVLIPLFLYVGLVVMRVALDYPVYGKLAIRDATTAIEAFTVLIGYRAIARDGLETWIRRLRWIFALVLIYASLSPLEEQLQAASPMVGLQRPVALLGSMAGVKFAAIAAAFFFVVFAGGWKRVVILGWSIGLLGIFQARSLYLLFPVAALVCGWALRRPFKMVATIAAACLVGVIALMQFSTLELEGRRGEVSGAFYLQHFKTLLGEEGTGAGTVEDRQEWTRQTLQHVTSSPKTFAFGVGLGPDLTFGFHRDGEVDVRKPHNDYLETFARLGIIGLMMFIWLIFALLKPIVHQIRHGGGRRWGFCAWVLTATVIYMGVAAVQPLLAFPYGTVPLFFFLGMGYAAATGNIGPLPAPQRPH